MKILNFNPRHERVVPRRHEHRISHSDFTGNDRCERCGLTPSQIEEAEEAAMFNAIFEPAERRRV